MGCPFGVSRQRLGKFGNAGKDWGRWKNFPGGTIPTEVKNVSAGRGWQFWENLEVLENSGSREKNMLYWKKLEIRARAPERGPLTNTGNSPPGPYNYAGT